MRVTGPPSEYLESTVFNRSRELVPLNESLPPVAIDDGRPPSDPNRGNSNFYPEDNFDGHDVRQLSPREMVSLSQDLYMRGIVNFDEYAALAFQPELHPKYDQTIGALTGEPAEPDRKRDFIAYWEDRMAFERKYNTVDSKDVAVSQRIVDILRALEPEPVNITT